MTSRRFGGAHGNFSVAAEHGFDRFQLGNVANRRRGGMGIEMLDVTGPQAGRPQTATSTSPVRMRRAASPIACTLAAQAVTGVPIGPLKPWRIEIWPAARFARKDGTVKGERRLTPR